MILERRKANNKPVVWKREEVNKLLHFITYESFNAKKLKELLPNRTIPSIRSKVRKLRISNDLFGASYRSDKECFTEQIAKETRPKIVFDAYAGAGHQTFKWIEYSEKVFASEIMHSKLSQFENTAKKHDFKPKDTNGNLWKLYVKGEKEIYLYLGDAINAAADLNVNRINIDLIDLDTCGSTIPVLSTFLVLLKPKHLVITHGEFHSMRFKREDVLRRLLMHRDISSNPFPLSVKMMSNELDKAVKITALRSHNESTDSFWLNLKNETWLGGKFHGMLRRYYTVERPIATADCINEISNNKRNGTSSKH
jgi:hypothetical protein